MRNETLERSEQTSTCRALVDPRPAPGPRAPEAHAQALAGFVTQLLACTGNLPSYRVRRRVAPVEASSIYGAGAVAPCGPSVSPRMVNRIL